MIQHEVVWSPGNIHALALTAYDAENKVHQEWYVDSNGGIPRGECRVQATLGKMLSVVGLNWLQAHREREMVTEILLGSSPMPITVRCEGCGRSYRANDKLAGKRVKCPKCSGVIQVPEADQQQAAQRPPSHGTTPREPPSQERPPSEHPARVACDAPAPASATPHVGENGPVVPEIVEQQERARKSRGMKKVGLALIITSLALLVSGCGLFGLIAIRAAAANKVFTQPLDMSKKALTDLIKVDTTRFCMVAVEVVVESDQVAKHTKKDLDTDKEVTTDRLKYRFPVSYRVLDAEGGLIHSQTTEIAHDRGGRTGSGEVSGPEGGTAKLCHNFDKFKVEDPGEIQIEMEIQPDSEFGATLESAKLVFYDNVSKHGSTTVGALALLGLTPVAFLAGLILVLEGVCSCGPPVSQLGQSSLVRQVPGVGSLMIFQGALEGLFALPWLLFGAIFLAFFSKITGSATEGRPHDLPWFFWLILSFPLLPGLLLLLAGALKIWAGILNRKYRGRVLGMVALVSAILMLAPLGCTWLAAPTSIALLVYGMVVYLNQEVRAAFRLGHQGYTADQIMTAVPPAS